MGSVGFKREENSILKRLQEFGYSNTEAAVFNSRMNTMDGRLWDTIHMCDCGGCEHHTESYDLKMFQVPIGNKDVGMTRTNMVAAGHLPLPEEFAINRVIISLSGTSNRVAAISDEDVCGLWVGQKPYFHDIISNGVEGASPLCPLHICNYCAGTFVGSICTGCGARDWHIIGEEYGADTGAYDGIQRLYPDYPSISPGPSPSSIVYRSWEFKLQVPVRIVPQQHFYTMIGHQPHTSDGTHYPVKIRVTLSGIHIRGVQ